MHFETCEILFVEVLLVRLVQTTLVWVFGLVTKCQRLCIIMLSVKNWVKHTFYKRRQWRKLSHARAVKTWTDFSEYNKKRSRFCSIKRSKSGERLLWWSSACEAQANWNSRRYKKSWKEITNQCKDKRNINSWNKHLKISESWIYMPSVYKFWGQQHNLLSFGICEQRELVLPYKKGEISKWRHSLLFLHTGVLRNLLYAQARPYTSWYKARKYSH